MCDRTCQPTPHASRLSGVHAIPAGDAIPATTQNLQAKAPHPMTAQEQAEKLAIAVASKVIEYAARSGAVQWKLSPSILSLIILEETNLAALIEEKEAWKRDANLLITYARHDERGCEKGFLPHLPCACGLDAIGNNHFALVEKYKE